MQIAAPIVTRQRLDAYHGAARRLLTRLFWAMLTGGWRGRGRKVRAVVSWFETLVERILFLEAVLRAGPPPMRPRAPKFARGGFRRKPRRLRLFFKRSGVRLRRAGVVRRVLRLFEALARPERVIAYFLRRLLNGLRTSGLVACAPPAVAITADAPLAPAFADSS
jgi:hypothetical protein